MVKYLILSLIGYYVFVNYISPMLEGNKKQININRNQKSQNNQDGEYVDYEEVD